MTDVEEEESSKDSIPSELSSTLTLIDDLN